MNKKPKILIIMVVLVVLIVSGYFFITSYFNTMEEKNFNDTIKNVSNIENESDIYFFNKTNVSSMQASVRSIYYSQYYNDTKLENEMLHNLSNKTNNKTLKKYVDLEVERTYLETKLWNEEKRLMDANVAYGKGQMARSDLQQYVDNVDEYDMLLSEKKLEVEMYLEDNPELKNRLYDLDIDEDFLIQQDENTRDYVLITS